MICKVRQHFISNPNTPRAHSGPVRIFGAVWGVWGVAEFKLRLQADFNLGFTRPAPQAGVRRMKIHAKMDPKSDPQIDIWALRGEIFEILGCFLRSRIFEGFLIGEKSANSLKIGGLGRPRGECAQILGRVGRAAAVGGFWSLTGTGKSLTMHLERPAPRRGAADLKGSALPRCVRRCSGSCEPCEHGSRNTI